jgi:hypothetical protein
MVVKWTYPNILEANYLPREDMIKLDYENGGVVGCVMHEAMRFKELFVIPCHKTLKI